MISFRADSGAESYGSGSLSDWAKSSAWSSDTGGEKDENGAPIRAQQGIWLEMWESAVKTEGPAEAGEAKAAAETVLLLRTPESLVHFLNDLMKAGGVNLKVKALHLMKDLYDGQDAAFVGAVRAHSTPFVSELLEYRCAPHPRYGDKPMMRVRKLARCATSPPSWQHCSQYLLVMPPLSRLLCVYGVASIGVDTNVSCYVCGYSRRFFLFAKAAARRDTSEAARAEIRGDRAVRIEPRNVCRRRSVSIRRRRENTAAFAETD
eukprot:COSAG02_NODE_3041_length_7489_cov_7.290798_8_plen_263_part_00